MTKYRKIRLKNIVKTSISFIQFSFYTDYHLERWSMILVHNNAGPLADSHEIKGFL